MRSSQFLVIGLMAAGAIAATGACGSGGGPSEYPDGETGGGSTSGQTTAGTGTTTGTTDGIGFDTAGGTTSGPAGNVTISEMRITPGAQTLTLPAQDSVDYVVEARLNGSSSWTNITSRCVFYLPEDGNLPKAFAIGGFPDNKSKFVAAAGTYGGVLKVRAAASNSDGTTGTVDATLTVIGSSVKLGASLPTDVKAEGADIGKRFGQGTGAGVATADATAAKKPLIAYPVDGTMMPPNLKRLSIHFTKGQITPSVDGTNDLFQIELATARGKSTYYTTCEVVTNVTDGCGFELDADLYKQIAESSRGEETTITVRGAAKADKTKFRQSASIKVRFSDEDVNGALYYWDTTKRGIWRFDFGSTQAAPELFVKEGDGNVKGQTSGCPGCHTLSRDGKKMVFSLNGQGDGQMLYVADMAKTQSTQNSGTSFYTVNGKRSGGAQGDKGANGKRLQFAAFNPDASKFVASYGDTYQDANCTAGNPAGSDCWDGWTGDPGATPLIESCDEVTKNKDCMTLWFHDATGARTAEKAVLPFEPSHLDWSPNGKYIAMTHVGLHNTAQRPSKSSIDIIESTGGGWSAPVALVPQPTNAQVHYNPIFAPNSGFVLFSQSTCPGTGEPTTERTGYRDGNCDGDADWTAKTLARRIKTSPLGPDGAIITLANSNKRGLKDNVQNQLGDTFPRFSPFVRKEKGKDLYWVTISSRRHFGLRNAKVNGNEDAQWLWMFAVDPAKIAAGQDGSYAAFLIPMQDLATSNHIGQWTEKIVSDNPPPPAPPPPPPPGPPPPPPVN